MNGPKLPPVPPGARAGGRRLWRSVLAKYELEEHELALLREAARLVDLLDELHQVTERDGAVIIGPDDQPRTHPAAVEARQSRIALSRVLAVLRLPEGDEGDVRRPQRRSGARGVYRFPTGA